MESVRETRGAKRVIEKCAGVEPEETVVVVGDWDTVANGGVERLASAAEATGANVSVVVMPPRDHDHNEPTAPVAASLMEADVAILALSQSIAHSRAGKRARDEGARWLSLVKYEPRDLVVDSLFGDYEAALPRAEKMTELLTAASEATITTPQGTDVSFSLDGREAALAQPFLREPGAVGSPEAMESTISPVRGTASGTIVIDWVIPDLGIGKVEENVVFEVEDGRVVSVSGGNAANVIESAWEGYDDPAVYNVAQLAVGMNPYIDSYDGRFIAAHCRYGSMHVGIGTSEGYLSGDVTAGVHFDGAMSEPTLALDGETVLEDGSTFTIE
jgi:leucyl aminopeptidase (aminopeptidase T)